MQDLGSYMLYKPGDEERRGLSKPELAWKGWLYIACVCLRWSIWKAGDEAATCTLGKWTDGWEEVWTDCCSWKAGREDWSSDQGQTGL